MMLTSEGLYFSTKYQFETLIQKIRLVLTYILFGLLVTIAIPAGAFMWLEGHTVMVFANYSDFINQK